jgi:CRISPR system Cascade subunit CasA
MDAHIQRQFNLVDEAWIPVAGEGLVSLKRVFTDPSLNALGGNPIEKIALTKLLLAIAQAAHTPENDEEWTALGAAGLAEKVARYLEEKRDLFWLYGDKPFLQMPTIFKAGVQPFGAVKPEIATGNTTILTEGQIEKVMSVEEKALLLVCLTCFAFGGKKTDNTIVLSKGYAGKVNEKGKPSTSKPGPSLGYLGYLHNFLHGGSLFELIWLNLLTKEHVNNLGQFDGVGLPPWEAFPEGENCDSAKALKKSLMGRLVPLCRFVLLTKQGIHYSEGIVHPTHKEGGFDPSIAVDLSSEKPKAIWVDVEKRPWRQITSLLSFLSSETVGSFDCPQLHFGVLRARKSVPEFNIWSGGLRVSSNAGEQYVSGDDDFVESEIVLCSSWLGELWFTNLKAEMQILDDMAKVIYGATLAYFKRQKVDGKKQAAMSTNLFWQLCERQFQRLVNVCGEDSAGKAAVVMRRTFVEYATRAFNEVCSRETARQMEAWAANRPNLGRFLQTIDKQ